MMSLLILLFYVTNQSLLLLIQIFMFANRLKLTDTNSTRKCTFKKRIIPAPKTTTDVKFGYAYGAIL